MKWPIAHSATRGRPAVIECTIGVYVVENVDSEPVTLTFRCSTDSRPQNAAQKGHTDDGDTILTVATRIPRPCSILSGEAFGAGWEEPWSEWRGGSAQQTTATRILLVTSTTQPGNPTRHCASRPRNVDNCCSRWPRSTSRVFLKHVRSSTRSVGKAGEGGAGCCGLRHTSCHGWRCTC